ncbi:MAG: type II secretion system secretin GspD [Bryobacteraceae bacterium]
MRAPVALFLSFVLLWLPLAQAQQPQPAAAQAPKPDAPKPDASKPEAAKPEAPKPEAPKVAAPKQTAPVQKVSTGSLKMNNAALSEVVDALCATLKINYIVDQKITGSVTVNTYGETKDIDARSLLELLLRINGFAMVQVGEFFRIVKMDAATRQPLPVVSQPGPSIPEDDQIMLNLIFLKYASVSEVAKLIEPFIGEGARTISYGPANLLFLLDSRRNIRRTMEIIGLFDSDTLASQRVRLFEVKNGAPSSISKEVEDILRSISLSDKNQVKFMPVDRINTIIAVAPNPGAFDEVEKWIRKLDTEIKVTAGGTDVYVYRVKYSRAEYLAMSITQLYGGFGFGGFGMMGMMGGMGGMGGYGGMGGMGGGFGGMGGMGGMGYGGMGGMMGGYGGMGGMMGGYGGMGGYPGMGGMGYGGMGYPGMGGAGLTYGAPQYPTPGFGAAGAAGQTAAGAAGTGAAGTAGAATDQTGSYLNGGGGYPRFPRIIPNFIDNTLLIQATAQEYQQIAKLLRELDIPPRQVLIDAKVYEVSLTGAFASGVAAALQKRGTSTNLKAIGTTGAAGIALSAGMIVDASRELMAFLSLAENTSRTKVISAPSVIATDSIAASINVGLEVPTLTAQAVSPVQSGGNSLFANSISSRSTGVNLSILARVNPSGIVTMVINQDVSAPVPPAPGSINSPSFSKRTVNTQVTVQDGDTIAIGGIITESSTSSSGGIPILHKLPIVGSAFGSRSYDKERSEMIIFMTPRVIYDTNQMVEASDELKSRLKRVNKIFQE